MKPRIHLRLERPNGHCSEAEINGDPVTTDMLDSAEDLLHTLTTGERPIIKNLYDLVARAFGTTREDAKKRLTGASYGKREVPMPSSIDRRRLADGDRALALPIRHGEPQSPEEIRAQLSVIYDGMVALQSLDDLGEEANRRAEENLRELERRYEALKALARMDQRTLELAEVHKLRTAVRRLLDAWNATQTTFGVDDRVHSAIAALEELV